MEHSFIESANDPEGPFPLNNLPYAVICDASAELEAGTADDQDSGHVVLAIGDYLLNLGGVAEHFPHVFDSDGANGEASLLSSKEAVRVFRSGSLNRYLRKGRPVWLQVRDKVTDLLRQEPVTYKDLREMYVQSGSGPVAGLLHKRANNPDVKYKLPITVGDYTDFYSSKQHALNVGEMFREVKNALAANWLSMPIGYHGRASSVVVSGTAVRRPWGQLAGEGGVSLGTCKRLDFELEMGIVIAKDNELGHPIAMHDAKEHVFGFTLMNDWSARDIQKWEYVPLGPFTAKNFATTISPFVVPLEALQPFRIPMQYPQTDPTPLSYLLPDPGTDGGDSVNDLHCAYNVDLTVSVKPREESTSSVVCKSNLKNLYWSVAQQVVHHTVTGCNLRAGDLLGSGTISGEESSSFGSMLELSWNATKEVVLENSGKVGGEQQTRTFLEDGDTVTMAGMARGNGYCIGFGECSGQVVEAKEM